MGYHPGLGQFVERDPKGYDGGPNLYQAFGSNPITRVDPFGLEPTTQPSTQPHDPTTCRACLRDPYPEDATDDAVNCDRYAFGLGLELMPNVVNEAIDAGILQGFGNDVNDELGGSWLDKNSDKLERSLDNYFNKYPAKGFKLNKVTDSCPCGYRKVAAQSYDPDIFRGRDYHFARQNADGTWSDKLRGSNASSCPGPFAKRDSSPQGVYCVKIPE